MTQDLVVFTPFSILALLFLLPVIGVVAMKGQAIEQCGGYPHSPFTDPSEFWMCTYIYVHKFPAFV